MDMAKTKLAQLSQHGDLLQRYGARIQVLGQRSFVKSDVLAEVDKAVELTKDNGDCTLNICFPYTSLDEMTTAVRETVREYSQPLSAESQQRRSFSESHIVHNIQARRLSTSMAAPAVKVTRSHSPSTSEGAASDAEESLSSSATTLYPDSPPPDPAIHPNEEVDTVHDLLKPASLSSPPHHHHQRRQSPQQPSYPDAETITADVLNSHMFTADLPPLDLLVRTSGVERLSDFMLWQCHQETEIVFLKCLWPDFDLWTFLPVLVEWQWKRRREAAAARSAVALGGRPAVKIKAG